MSGLGSQLTRRGREVGLAQQPGADARRSTWLDVGGVVLAAHRQHDAALLEVENPALEIDEGTARVVGAEGDAVDAVFADDAAPQRVVGIEHQHLGTRRLQQDADIGDAMQPGPRRRVGANGKRAEYQ